MLNLIPEDSKILDPNANNTINLTLKAMAREIAYHSATQVLLKIQGFTAQNIMKQPYALVQVIAFRIKIKRPEHLVFTTLISLFRFGSWK
jgi:hypothetical protein